jgi:hypothetical protein
MRVTAMMCRGVVGLAVPAPVQSLPGRLAARCWDRGDAAEVRPGRFAADPFRVVTGGDEQGGSGVGADAEDLEQAGGSGGHEGHEELVDALRFGLECRHPSAQGGHGETCCVEDRIGARSRSPAGGLSREAVPRQRLGGFAHLVGSADRQVADLVAGADPFLSAAALDDGQRSDRFDRAVCVFARALRSSGERGGPSGDGVDAVGLAVTMPGLAVGPVDLNHLDARASQEPCQASPVGAGALDTDQPDRTERAEPVQQCPVAGGIGGEGLGAVHPAQRVQRRGDVVVEMRVDTTGHAHAQARLYHGHRHPFPSLHRCNRGGTALAGRALRSRASSTGHVATRPTGECHNVK